MDTERRHARRWGHRLVVTLVGAALAVPPVALAPAQGSEPLPCVPGVNCDEVAPFTKLTTTPAVVAGNKTKEKAASFAFTASDDEAGETPTEGASFACELTGPGQPAGFTPCPTPKAYENLADGTYTFKVQASDPSGNTDATPETFTWTVDTTAPETTVSGPNGWVLASKVTFGLGSSEPGSSFRCTLDGSGRYCNAAGGTVSFAAGTHTFAAKARDSLGHEDASPATRTFTLPVNNTELRHSRGWRKATGSGYFMKSRSSSTKKGAVLKTSSSAITSVALVVTKGRGYGVVKVYLGSKLLKKVSLAARRTKKQRLVQVASFAAARSGTIKVVVASSNKLVVVEGLGIASR